MLAPALKSAQAQSYIDTFRVQLLFLATAPFRFHLRFCTAASPCAIMNLIFYDLLSLFFSSRQIHNAAIRAISTPGATVTPYVCCPKKMSLPLRSLRSMRATTMSGGVSIDGVVEGVARVGCEGRRGTYYPAPHPRYQPTYRANCRAW